VTNVCKKPTKNLFTRYELSQTIMPWTTQLRRSYWNRTLSAIPGLRCNLLLVTVRVRQLTDVNQTKPHHTTHRYRTNSLDCFLPSASSCMADRQHCLACPALQHGAKITSLPPRCLPKHIALHGCTDVSTRFQCNGFYFWKLKNSPGPGEEALSLSHLTSPVGIQPTANDLLIFELYVTLSSFCFQ